MQKIRKWLAIAGMMCAALSVQAAGLTEQSVEQMMKSIDAAAARKNADVIANLMSPAVSIRMTINAGGQTQTLTPNRQEYLQMLKDGWAMSTDYRYARSGTKISLIDTNKALVKGTIRESMKVQGQTMSGETVEEVTIELVQGKPLITKVVGNSKM
jgi:hypothetical protein